MSTPIQLHEKPAAAAPNPDDSLFLAGPTGGVRKLPAAYYGPTIFSPRSQTDAEKAVARSNLGITRSVGGGQPYLQYLGVIFSGTDWSPETGILKAPGAIIRTANLPAAAKISATEQYRIYWSSDHATTGHIYCAWSAVKDLQTLLSSGKNAWTYLGEVWNDAAMPLVGGQPLAVQVEFPDVHYFNGKWHMFLQSQLSNTHPATTSTDGVLYNTAVNAWNQCTVHLTSDLGTTTWALDRWSCMDVPGTGFVPGDLHSGYQRFFRKDGKLMSIGLMGGTGHGLFALHESTDGTADTLRLDRRLMPMDRSYLVGAEYWQRNQVEPFFWKGSWYQILQKFSGPGSGGFFPQAAMYLCKLSDDLHRIVAEPTLLTNGTAENCSFASGMMITISPDEVYMVRAAKGLSDNLSKMIAYRIVG